MSAYRTFTVSSLESTAETRVTRRSPPTIAVRREQLGQRIDEVPPSPWRFPD